MCLYITKRCFMTLVIGEVWLHAPQDPFCSHQPFQHCWWCHGAVDLGALGVMCWVCWAWDTSQEMSMRWRLLQAAACSAPQPPSVQGCGTLVLGERKGKFVVSPACKGHSVCVAVSTARLHFHCALLLVSLSSGGGAPPLAREAGGVLPLNLLLLLRLHTLLPVVPALLPAARHPCPCMGPPAWHLDRSGQQRGAAPLLPRPGIPPPAVTQTRSGAACAGRTNVLELGRGRQDTNCPKVLC